MLTPSCSGNGCGRWICAWAKQGVHPLARNALDYFALGWSRCRSCGLFTCDRCLPRQGKLCRCGASLDGWHTDRHDVVARELLRELGEVNAQMHAQAAAMGVHPPASPFLQIQWNALPRGVREYLVRAQREPSPCYCWLGPARTESRGFGPLVDRVFAGMRRMSAESARSLVGSFRLMSHEIRGWFAHAGRALRRRKVPPSPLPDPQIEASGGCFAALFSLGGASVLLLLLLAFVLGDYGDPKRDGLCQGPGWIVTYAVMVGLILRGVLSVARGSRERPLRDYADGFLLFAGTLIEFRGTCVRIRTFVPTKGVFTTFEALRYRWLRSRRVSRQVNYKGYGWVPEYEYFYEPTAYLFTIEFEDAEFGFERRAGSHDVNVYFSDPLEGLRTHPDWPRMLATAAAPPLPPPVDGGPACGLSRTAPRFLRVPSYVIAGAALLVGPTLWLVRNWASDEAGYRSAATMGAAGYAAYVRNGRLHRDEAQEALDHAQYAERGWPFLQEFVRRFPRHPKATEARASLRTHFERLAQSFPAQSATTNPAAASFVQGALAFQERNASPPIVVRFAPPPDAVVAALDAETGSIARIRREVPVALAPHFAQAEMRLRERRVVENLQAAFRGVFPEVVFRFEDGGRVVPRAAPPAGVHFEVVYVIAPTGAYLAGFGEGARAPGAAFDFRVTATVPGGPAFTFTTNVPPTPGGLDLRAVTTTRGSPVGSAACDRAFALFSDRLRGAFFRPGSPARGTPHPEDVAAPTTAPDVSGVWRATLTDVNSARPASVRLTLERSGAGVTGSYRSAHGGPRVPDGTVTGSLSGRQLTATCADEDGAASPCVLAFSDDAHFTGMTNAGALHTWWVGERR